MIHSMESPSEARDQSQITAQTPRRAETGKQCSLSRFVHFTLTSLLDSLFASLGALPRVFKAHIKMAAHAP